MIYLLGSIFLSAFLTIGFKICQRLNISTFQVIVFNYITCITTGAIITGNSPFESTVLQKPWLPWAVVLGCCFILFFNLTARTVKTSGVAIAGVATKISLFIPFLFSVYYFGEPAGVVRFAGVAIAMGSVVMICYPSQTNNLQTSGRLTFLLPLILVLGTGFQDTLIKYSEQVHVPPQDVDAFLTTCFVVAGTVGVLLMGIALATGKIRLQPKAIPSGIAIGIPNYFSIWCMIAMLKFYPGASSVAIPINNMGILMVNTIVGYVVMKEKLPRVNMAGIGLAILAIWAITAGKA